MESTVSLKEKLAENKENFTKILTLAAIVVLAVAFFSMNHSFLSKRNILNILKDLSPIMIMSAGQAFCLMLGSIDLSTGCIASCAAVMLTVLMGQIGAAAYLVVIVYGIGAGLLNGFVHARLGIPSFIATLSTQAIWASAALLISGGQPLSMLPAVWPYVDWGKIVFFDVIPLLFIVALVILIIISVISKFFTVGHTILAAGANERATWLIGLDVKKAKVVAFLLSGTGAAIGGILFAVKLKSGIPTVGVPYNMYSIAAAVMSGVSMSGGKGSIFMTLLGSLLIAMIQNGMNVVGVDGLWQNIIFGALLLFAIFLNSNKDHKGLIVK